jgi:glucosamine--fructose-6-phosphate aminotransferase (isomerizing)
MAVSVLESEIREQPEAVERLLARVEDDLRPLGVAVERRPPSYVLVAARGTSDNAARYAQYLLGGRLGLPVALAAPSLTSVYAEESHLRIRDALVIGISQSGRSPDVVEVLRVARAGGSPSIALTNDPESPLAAAADFVVPLCAGPERAVAATKTYTAELLALYLLLVGGDAAGLPEAAARTLDHGEAAYAAAERFLLVDRLVTTARGFSYPTAREGALKLMETSYLAAQAFSGADLLHGPLAMLGPDVPVIAVTTTGRGAAALTPVLERLAAAQVDVLRVGSPDGLPVVLDGVHESLAPVLEILPLQQLAWRLALDRGGDPDRPRGLSKVTETW